MPTAKSTALIFREVNTETGEISERPMTAEEIAGINAAAEQAAAEQAAKDAARAALLDRLGITADEARLLLS